MILIVLSFKASETLLGIETWGDRLSTKNKPSFKASETLLGIETHTLQLNSKQASSFKASETLLGIETSFRRLIDLLAING